MKFNLPILENTENYYRVYIESLDYDKKVIEESYISQFKNIDEIKDYFLGAFPKDFTYLIVVKEYETYKTVFTYNASKKAIENDIDEIMRIYRINEENAKRSNCDDFLF